MLSQYRNSTVGVPYSNSSIYQLNKAPQERDEFPYQQTNVELRNELMLET